MRDWTSSILKLCVYILLIIFASWAIDVNLLYGIILGLVFHFSLRPKWIYSHNLAIISFIIFEIYRGNSIYFLPIFATAVYAIITWNRKKILSYSKISQVRYCFIFFICIFTCQIFIEFLTGSGKGFYKIPMQIFGIFLTLSSIGIKNKSVTKRKNPTSWP